MSFGSSSSKTTQFSKSNSSKDPWDPTVEPLKDYIKSITGIDATEITPDQFSAFQQLKENASQGNPFTPQIGDLAERQLGYDNSGTRDIASNAYQGLQDNLGAYARGDYLDVMNNPQLKAMMDQVAQNAQDRINRNFAGMGRARSGINQQAVSRGITEAQLPLLLDQFNQQQANQINAANALYGAGNTTSSQLSDLDRFRTDMNTAGITLGEQALKARDYAPNQILNLDKQIQSLPYENLALLGSLLLPLAGLGGTSNTSSSGTSKSKGSSFGISLSDERAKENIAEVGELADGQKVYAYNYKGDDTPQIGLMAQEVEEKYPEAVGEFSNGLKGVDYGMATERAAQIVARQMARKRKGS